MWSPSKSLGCRCLPSCWRWVLLAIMRRRQCAFILCGHHVCRRELGLASQVPCPLPRQLEIFCRQTGHLGGRALPPPLQILHLSAAVHGDAATGAQMELGRRRRDLQRRSCRLSLWRLETLTEGALVIQLRAEEEQRHLDLVYGSAKARMSSIRALSNADTAPLCDRARGDCVK